MSKKKFKKSLRKQFLWFKENIKILIYNKILSSSVVSITDFLQFNYNSSCWNRLNAQFYRSRKHSQLLVQKKEAKKNLSEMLRKQNNYQDNLTTSREVFFFCLSIQFCCNSDKVEAYNSSNNKLLIIILQQQYQAKLDAMWDGFGNMKPDIGIELKS